MEVKSEIMKVMFNGVNILFFILERKKRGIKLVIIIRVEFKIGICIFLEVLKIIVRIFFCFFLGFCLFFCKCLNIFFIFIIVLFIKELIVMVIFFKFIVLMVSFKVFKVRIVIIIESGMVINEIMVVCIFIRNKSSIIIIKILFLYKDF